MSGSVAGCCCVFYILCVHCDTCVCVCVSDVGYCGILPIFGCGHVRLQPVSYPGPQQRECPEKGLFTSESRSKNSTGTKPTEWELCQRSGTFSI